MLTKDTKNGLIFGVCAGLANEFDLDVSIVRLIAVLGFIFTGSIVGWIYIFAAILLPKQE